MSDRQKCNVCSDFMPLDGTTANPWSGLVMKGSPVRVRASALRKALQTAPAGCGPRGRRAGARRAPRRPGNRRTYAAAAAGRRGPSRRRRRYVGDDLIGDAVRRFVASGRSTATSRSDPDRSGCGCRRVLGIAGLTWAFTRLAANTAAHVTLTEMPRLHIPFSSGGGDLDQRRVDRHAAACSGAPTRRRARAAGIRAGSAHAPDVHADVQDAVPVARVAGANHDTACTAEVAHP
jgi:hypothetical protein